jgi:putative ABC transport system permease protein
MDKWLKDFAYHTPIMWFIFAANAFGAIGISMITVSFQAIRATIVSPVKSLRSE